ncbi:hypothetical protein T440DRAFT_468010 [Plenodomus tracheiphilus IPT5]|uniref:N-acetyltransferase domain-containing protein n=1 Tax=Plenodomus tracheiphilus IPT5 TaxID=1408161 RepID=A0A6A7B8W8_9PLEO|nr:hypothetical protein T440DRAFT_468010 [Plenodomus tracheiphilus IPT5]
MSSTCSLRPARFADLNSVARIWTAAFFEDEIIGDLMHPNRKDYPEDVYWFLLRGVREHFWNWRHHLIVATIDSTSDKGHASETIVGAADWRRLGYGGAKRELAWADPRSLIAPILRCYHRASLVMFPNRAADPTQSAWLDNAVAASAQHWTGTRSECWDLHVCGVHPNFQGKGVGRLLAQWGVDQAAKEGEHVVASVLCGEKNREFYGKAGFQVEVSRGEDGLALFTR